MLRKQFGKLGWPVSVVGLGTWNIGNQWGEIDDTTAWATIRAAYEAGMTLFDTAESYGIPNGLSEKRFWGIKSSHLALYITETWHNSSARLAK